MMLTNLLAVILAASYATAKFDLADENCYSALINSHGVQAQVFLCSLDTISNKVQVLVDTTSADMTALPKDCNLDGLSYHVHDFWNLKEETMAFDTQCGKEITGGHYDPTRACGAASGNPACAKQGVENKKYQCSSSTYPLSPYECEVGDLSGKFGSISTSMQKTWIRKVDSFGVPYNQLNGKSIVFHCNGGARAFCGKLVKVPDTTLYPSLLF